MVQVNTQFEFVNFFYLRRQIDMEHSDESWYKILQECCRWIFDNLIEAKDEELRLIETLRTVSSGKIYVEVERARLTHRLAKMYEAEGQIAKAAATMHELQVSDSVTVKWPLSDLCIMEIPTFDFQVETYGSMDKQEKVELILEQMRYCIATKDFIRTQIISKKISIRFFDKDEFQVNYFGNVDLEYVR